MKLIMLFSMLISISISSYGQLGSISGSITEDEFGDPVFEAFIKAVGEEGGTISDLDGVYSLDLRAGVYTLEISHPTYNTLTFKNVHVTEDKVTILDVKMSTGQDKLDQVTISVRAKKAEGDDDIIAMCEIICQ